MRKVLLATCVSVLAALAAGAANANDELNKMAQNPKDWVMPTGDYANTRYSKLNQINATNVNKLQVAWTFSTGVLRGHEGGPLIIGNILMFRDINHLTTVASEWFAPMLEAVVMPYLHGS